MVNPNSSTLQNVTLLFVKCVTNTKLRRLINNIMIYHAYKAMQWHINNLTGIPTVDRCSQTKTNYKETKNKNKKILNKTMKISLFIKIKTKN